MTAKTGPLLSVANLTTCILTPAGPRTVVDGLDFTVEAGEVLALIGESGSGKSVATQSLLGLLPSPPGRVVAGTALFEGRDLLALTPAQLQQVRGNRIGAIFQEPMAALNPMLPVGEQIAETLVTHRNMDRQAARAEALRLLDRVRIPDAAARARLHPVALSGGMCQRVVIAAVLACKPALVIADEPTTALDATVQAEILALLRELQAESGCGIVCITHDMDVVRQIADRVLVMRSGRAVESGTRDAVLQAPRHDYTRMLIEATRPATPRAPVAPAPKVATDPLVIEDLTVSFPRAQSLLAVRRAERLFAVDGVSLRVRAGETLALVGESGSGKSTLARAILGLAGIDAGRVRVQGRDVVTERERLRGRVQYVFQDPQSSLDPRWRAWQSVAEPLRLAGERRPGVLRETAAACMARVGLADHADRYPHELSGGQRQRLGIARALSVAPDLVIADEAVSALDAATRLQVLELLDRIQRDTGLPLLFITHDFSVVTRIAHRVAVLRFGQLLEIGPTAAVLQRPQHAYTRALIAAAMTGEAASLPGSRGHRLGAAGSQRPWRPMREVGDGHFVTEEDAPAASSQDDARRMNPGAGPDPALPADMNRLSMEGPR
ncbi:ABC transporter ATP-binding protein [Niveibacterium sp. SC-1]|uniref:ABC transporter ATP-binding protein n=1 Tax=Niveibacterium sp. SC-1 TaxID=3135646 RepID=UPI00311FA224